MHLVYTSSTKNVYKFIHMYKFSLCNIHYAMSLIITINWCALTVVASCFANCDVILHSTYAGGHSKLAMYTELHQDYSLSLFFNSLQEDQAGKYTCKGNYASNVQLSKSVTIDTISEYRKFRRIFIFKWNYSDME